MKQTAVDWLVQQMIDKKFFASDTPLSYTTLDHLVYEAKQKEQEQMKISDDFQIGPNGAYEHIGNQLDLDYQDLLQDILDNGVEKKTRNGSTISVFGRQIRHNMKDGFPLLTTKKMFFKGIVTELLWFLRGDTNIKYLVQNGCNIWNGDAWTRYINEFRRTCPKCPEITQEEFINKMKTDDEFANRWGELGPIYGKQWREWNKVNFDNIIVDYSGDNTGYTLHEPIDQIANLIRDLKTNPDSRRLMVSAWNVGELDQMVLPPCHYGFQVYTRELSLFERTTLFCTKTGQKDWKERVQATIENQGEETLNKEFEKHNIPTRAISLMWNQRSVDTFLGLPFNIASYGLLLEIIAKEVNMVPDQLIGNLGDVHLYSNHIEQAKEQIDRTPYELPTLNINTEWWPTESGECGVGPIDAQAVFSTNNEHFYKCLLEEDIQLGNYQSHPTIKAPLSN